MLTVNTVNIAIQDYFRELFGSDFFNLKAFSVVGGKQSPDLQTVLFV